MLLYLIQHAQSKSEAEDPERPLSDKGQTTAKRIAVLFSRVQPRIAAIRHSDKLRARQTAEIFARSLQATDKIQQVAGLAPMDDANPVAARLQQHREDLLIVGHLPHLSRLASQLLVGDTEQKVIAFQMAGIVCLQRDASDQWSLWWILTPELANCLHAGDR